MKIFTENILFVLRVLDRLMCHLVGMVINDHIINQTEHATNQYLANIRRSD